MNLSIRKASEKDTDAIYALICELENTKYSKSAFCELLKQNVNDKRIGYFVAQVDEQTVGFGSVYLNKLLHHCGTVAEIQELIISEVYRDKKIGSNLLSEMIKWSEQHKALQVEVCCNNSRNKAQSFYESNGFVQTHQKLVLDRG
jgi:PhnO protein